MYALERGPPFYILSNDTHSSNPLIYYSIFIILILVKVFVADIQDNHISSIYLKQVATLTLGVTDVDICVFPPHPFLVPVFDKIEATNVKLGAQNCHFEDSGTCHSMHICKPRDRIDGLTYYVKSFGQS